MGGTPAVKTLVEVEPVLSLGVTRPNNNEQGKKKKKDDWKVLEQLNLGHVSRALVSHRGLFSSSCRSPLKQLELSGPHHP